MSTAPQPRHGERGGEALLRDQPRVAKELQSKGMMQDMKERAPYTWKQVIGTIALLILGTLLLVGGGLALGGTVITLILASPLLLLFSPVLIPLGIFLFVVTAGVLTAGATFLVFLGAVSWMYRYFRGRRPMGADQVEAARHRVIDTASQVKERAKEYGTNVAGYLQPRSQGADPASGAY